MLDDIYTITLQFIKNYKAILENSAQRIIFAV